MKIKFLAVSAILILATACSEKSDSNSNQEATVDVCDNLKDVKSAAECYCDYNNKLDDENLSEEEFDNLEKEFDKINEELDVIIMDKKIYTENELEAELEKIGCN